MPDWIAPFADICGIAGFVFSIIIWRSTNKIKEQLLVYKKTQKQIVAELVGHRDSIIRDGLYSLDIRSKLRTCLFAVMQNYRSLLSVRERLKIRILLYQLNHPNREKLESLCASLDYIVARFQKKENAN